MNLSINEREPGDESRDFDDFGGVSAHVPGQAESRQARADLDKWFHEQVEEPAWVPIWRDLIEERAPMLDRAGELLVNERGEARTKRRWNWRQALYIAWMATPKKQRQPETLEKLTPLLGLSSSGTIRNWRRNDPEIDERIRMLPKRMLFGHLADVYQALVTVATDADPKAHQDRRLFLELVGEYSPKGTTVLAGEAGAPVYVDLTHELGTLADEDLDALARIAGRFGGDSGGAGTPSTD